MSANILERAGQAVDPALPVRDGREDARRLGPDEPAHPDRRDLDRRGPGPSSLPRRWPMRYVNYVRDTAQEVDAAAVGDLTNRRDDLQAQVEQLQKEIAATETRQKLVRPDSSDGRAESAAAGEPARRSRPTLAVQLDKVQDKIADGHAGRDLGDAARLVVQQATAAEGPATVAAAAHLGHRRGAGLHPAGGRLVLADRPSRPAGPTARRHRRCDRQPGAGGDPQSDRSGRWPGGRRCSGTIG